MNRDMTVSKMFDNCAVRIIFRPEGAFIVPVCEWGNVFVIGGKPGAGKTPFESHIINARLRKSALFRRSDMRTTRRNGGKK